ncbi:MAG TPA: DUF1778 domain-containing protein [Pirellulales bacterium]|nr:DUF1778 domain-containing protein [Pirellulales bacterium]
MTQHGTSTIQLDLRLSPQAEQKLEAAANVAQRSVAEFVLESALIRADETLADRTRFGLDADHWKAFVEALDAEPRDLPRLQRLFQEGSVFEASGTP